LREQMSTFQMSFKCYTSETAVRNVHKQSLSELYLNKATSVNSNFLAWYFLPRNKTIVEFYFVSCRFYSILFSVVQNWLRRHTREIF